MAYWTATEVVGPRGTNQELQNAIKAWERIYVSQPKLLRLHVAAFRASAWMLRRCLGLRN